MEAQRHLRASAQKWRIAVVVGICLAGAWGWGAALRMGWGGSATVHPSIPLQLLDGDLVFRRGRDAVAEAVVLGSRNARFSHVGLLVRLQGEPWVVHAAPAEGGGLDGVRVQPLAAFIDPRVASDAAVYRLTLTPAQRQRVREYALARRGAPFDGALRYSTDDSLYCTELALKALAAAGVDVRPRLSGQAVLWLQEPVYSPEALRRLPALVEVRGIAAADAAGEGAFRRAARVTSPPAP